MDVFQAFTSVPYTFLQVARGGVAGNMVVDSVSATGVFKLRSQFVRGQDSEQKDSNATLHIRPEEEFVSFNDQDLIGHGISVEGNTYEIVEFTGGMNFETGDMEHYTATLQETKFSDYEVTS